MQLDSEEQLPEEDLQSQPSLTSVQTNENLIRTSKHKFVKCSVSQPTAASKLMDYLINKKKKRKPNFQRFATSS
jgi:hypothetical protein